MILNLKKRFRLLSPLSDCYLCCEEAAAKKDQSRLICQHCHDRLPRLRDGCPVCAMPVASASNSPCGDCLKDSPHYHQTIAAFHYETPVSDLITRLKYHGKHHFVPLLSEYLLKAVKEHYVAQDLPEVIIPVPLHSKKIRERGFNQAHLIAQSLCQQLPVQLLTQGVTRSRYTQAQSALDANQRQRNLKGAFSVKSITAHHVAIVDDVMTTGTTVNELSHELLQAGASRVDIWCVARAFAI